MQGGNGGMENVYEVYYCTRSHGHIGGHIACWDDIDPKDSSKTIHKSKSWIGDTGNNHHHK